jgi:uncharacterized membrane protein YcaP (DUF421 family)
MKQIIEIFGEGKDLNMLQMGARGIIIFVAALVLIRISGRRSFGIKTPMDTIVALLLGAMLSRAVAGVSPFWPVVFTCFIIAVLHRLFGLLMVYNSRLSSIIDGEKIVLFRDQQFIAENMKRALVCKEDIMQGVRKVAKTERLDKIDKIYIETNGEITVINKEG